MRVTNTSVDEANDHPAPLVMTSGAHGSGGAHVRYQH